MNGLAAPQAQQGPIDQVAETIDGLPVPQMATGPEDEAIGKDLKSEQADPQHQKMYEALAEPMLGIIHGPESNQQIESQLRNGKSVGALTFEIAMAVVSQIEKSGKQVPLEPLQDAAEDVVEDLVEISVAMKLIPDDQDAIEQAYMNGLTEAIEKYGIESRKSGKMSPEENQQHFDAAVKLGGFDTSVMAKAVKQGISDAS